MVYERNALKKYDMLQNRFIIYDILGQGGFGLTYLVLDMSEKTSMVIKECAPYGKSYRKKGIVFLNDDFRRMQLELYENEATILQELSDLQGVVSFRDFFVENNTFYTAMEYIKGISLKEIVENSDKGNFIEYIKLNPHLKWGLLTDGKIGALRW